MGETGFLMGVADVARMGALRLRWTGTEKIEGTGYVPQVSDLPKLQSAIGRYLSDDSVDHLGLMVGAGASHGGSGLKVSVQIADGTLMMAKFPTAKDRHSVESWEEFAMRLAGLARIEVQSHKLVTMAGSKLFLSQRIDRAGKSSLPYLSAMTMIGSAYGEKRSYPELAESLQLHGAQ